jgi:hypothetical protein
MALPVTAPVYASADELSQYPAPGTVFRYAIVDGIGLFRWYANDTTSADSVTVIAPSGGAVGRWKITAPFPGAPTWLRPVTVVATSNITLSGLQTIDGIALAAGDVVLPTAQTDTTQNVPMVVASGAWTRPTWFDTSAEVLVGSLIPVVRGNTYAGSLWRISSPTTGTITLGSTAISWSLLSLAYSPSTTSDGVVIPASGDTTGAIDRLAIATAIANGRNAYLIPGATYYLDQRTTVTAASPGGIIGDAANPANICQGTLFAVGGADDPTNCYFRYSSTLAGADTTTLSASIRRGRRSFTTTAPLTSPIGKTYRFRSIGSASGGLGGLDTDVEITELVTVESGTGPYIADKAIGATHGANVDASNTTQVREVTTVVRDVVVTGVRFHSAQSVGGAATTMAAAILLEHVVGANISIEASGFSRAAVEWHFSRDCSVSVTGCGGNNGLCWERTSQESRVHVVNKAGGLRCHTLGTPRAMLYVDYLSAGGQYTGDIQNCVVGAEFVGYIDAFVPRFHVTDADCTERVNRDAARLLDVGGSQGVGAGIMIRGIQTGTTFDESPYGMVMGEIHLLQCGGPTTDAAQLAWLAVDTHGIKISSLTIENKGGDATVTEPYRTGGAMWVDTYSAQIDSYQTSGVENALAFYGSWNRLHIGTWRWDPVNAHTNMQIALRWGMVGDGATGGQPIAVSIGRMLCPDTPTFIIANLNGVTVNDLSRDGLEIGELLIDNKTAKGSNYGRVRWFVGGDSYAPATGELAEIIPPQVATFDNGTDVWSCAAHGLANGTPVYVRAQPNDGAAVLPTGYTATTIYWVVNRAAGSFQLSTTKGGAAYTGGSTNGTADIEVVPAIPAIRAPSTGPAAALRHVVVVNGSSFGSGPLPAGYYLCSLGPMCMVRTDDVAHAGDTLEVAASTGLANNNLAAADPFALVLGAKSAAAAGIVQCRRVA